MLQNINTNSNFINMLELEQDQETIELVTDEISENLMDSFK